MRREELQMAVGSIVESHHASKGAERPPAWRLKLRLGLLWVQGLYFLVTGIWPLLSIRTFILATGPKTDHLITGREEDHWLIMTVSVLIVAIAVTLLVAAWRRRDPPEA